MFFFSRTNTFTRYRDTQKHQKSRSKKIFLSKKDNEQQYRPLDLIEKYGLEKDVRTITEFVPNEDVHKYFQVSDAILLFYLTATPSGVESMAGMMQKSIEKPIPSDHVYATSAEMSWANYASMIHRIISGS